MNDTPRIDAHHHFWDPTDFVYPWMEGHAMDPVRRPFGPADLARELETNGIDGSVLIQTVSDTQETENFLAIARETTFIYGVVGWVDLSDIAVGENLDSLRSEYGALLAGIRHQVHDEIDAEWLGRDDVRRGIEAVGSRGLAYDLLVRTRELPSASALVRDLADQRFVLDHIAKPPIATGWDNNWSRRLGSLAAFPNVSVKLSGMVTEAEWGRWTAETLRPYVERVIELFGTDRVMFGSDWPVCLLSATNYGEVLDAVSSILDGLSGEESRSVFGGNAQRWYELQIPSPLP